MKDKAIICDESNLKSKIYMIRGKQVMLDFDLADKRFWSSSTSADGMDQAWFADFSLGLMGNNLKDYEGSYALCVR